jgi:hypothetical protein
MNKPIYSAGLAAAYIVGVVLLISLGPIFFGEPDNILMPMGMLALLVLSVAVMGFLFFYRPLALMLEGDHAEAAKFFLATLGIFALFTFGILAVAALVSLAMS